MRAVQCLVFVLADVMVLTRLAIEGHLIACLTVAAYVVASFLVTKKIEAAKLGGSLSLAQMVPAGRYPKWLHFQKKFVPQTMLVPNAPADSLLLQFDQKLAAPMDRQLALFLKLWRLDIASMNAHPMDRFGQLSLGPWQTFAKAS